MNVFLIIAILVAVIATLVLGVYIGTSGMKARCLGVFYEALRDSGLSRVQQVEVMDSVEKELRANY